MHICLDQVPSLLRARHVDFETTSDRIRIGLRSFAPLSALTTAHRERKRQEAMDRAMPEALRTLGTALQSGSSLPLALRSAADNCAEPLSSELKQVVWDLEAGQGFDEALERLRTRTNSQEFAFLAVAMEIQHRSGGPLSEILEGVSNIIRETNQLKEELRTKTEQGRLSSRIVVVMPFVLLGVLSLFSPGYLDSFFSSPIGWLLFALALMLELLGVVLVRRALHIDFSMTCEDA